MPMDNKKTAVTIIKNRFDKFEIYKRENIIGGKISADPRSGCLKINNIGIKVIIITFVITFKESLGLLDKVVIGVGDVRYNSMAVEMNYTEPFGAKWICSRGVKVSV